MLPLAFGQTAPPLPAHVHVADTRPAGSGSLMTVFGAGTSPVLVTVTV